MKKLILGGLFLMLSLTLACQRKTAVISPADPTAVTEVVMRQMQFSPATVEIKKGAVVEWKNEDFITHTATSRAFGDSGPLTNGKSWRHTFTETGRFAYICTFHPEMKGVVIVK